MSRILTLQRQVRELGRLRAGLTQTKTNDRGQEVTFPKHSKTWILTSTQREYLDVAAELWGGQVEQWQPQGNYPQAWRLITGTDTIDALLPPGDPVNQAYELWSGGGVQRRCNGETELRSDQPCLCRAQFGEDFHEQKAGTRCQITTRLNVFLPDLPDIGVWRAESHGYWPGNRIVGMVDLIKAQVGASAIVPVRLWIVPRTKKVDGRTSHYVEIVVSVRGLFRDVLAGNVAVAAIGAGSTPAVEGGPERQAIEAGPAIEPANGNGGGRVVTVVDLRAALAKAKTPENVRRLWDQAKAAGIQDTELAAEMKAKAAELQSAAPEPANEAPAARPEVEQGDHPVDAEVEPDRQAMWTQILAWGGGQDPKLTTAQCSAIVRDHVGKGPEDCNGWELEHILAQMKAGRVMA